MNGSDMAAGGMREAGVLPMPRSGYRAPAVQVVEALYAALARCDLEAVLERCSLYVEIYLSEHLPAGGRHRGLDEARSFFERVMREMPGSLAIRRIIPAGERVVAIGTLQATVPATGARLDLDSVNVWTVRAGKITTAEFYVDTPALLEALGMGSAMRRVAPRAGLADGRAAAPGDGGRQAA